MIRAKLLAGESAVGASTLNEGDNVSGASDVNAGNDEGGSCILIVKFLTYEVMKIFHASDRGFLEGQEGRMSSQEVLVHDGMTIPRKRVIAIEGNKNVIHDYADSQDGTREVNRTFIWGDLSIGARSQVGVQVFVR